MHLISISPEAEEDIDGIAEYTKSTWGWRQTDMYLTRLEESVEMLAQNPLIGRLCDSIHPGLRRFEVGKHVVFYIAEENRILVVRILHQQMVTSKTRFEH